VLFVTSTYPDHPGSVRGIFIKELAIELARRGVAVDVLTPRIFADSLEREETEGINVFRFTFSSEQKLLAEYSSVPVRVMLSYLLCGSRALARLIRMKNYDLLHAHWAIPTGLIGAWDARKSGIPLVVSTHGSDLLVWGRKPILRSLLRWTLQQARICTANSEPMLRLTKKLGGNTLAESLVFETGVDIAQFFPPRDISEAKKAVGLDAGDRHLLFVGNLTEAKGIDVALKALALLQNEDRRVKLLVIGQGKAAAALADLANKLHVHPEVQFLGARPHDHLPPFFRAADIFLLPSRSEGMGIVLLEAAASGKPAVGTAVGGIPTIIRDGETGFVVAPDDPRSLAEKVKVLLQNPQLRAEMGQRARELAEIEFSREKQIAKILAVYEYAMSPRM